MNHLNADQFGSLGTPSVLRRRCSLGAYWPHFLLEGSNVRPKGQKDGTYVSGFLVW